MLPHKNFAFLQRPPSLHIIPFCSQSLIIVRHFITTFFRRTSEPWTYNQVSEWIEKFSKDSIPKETLQISYSRGSGPGGQNVNKVSTKVNLRVQLSKAIWIPPHALTKIREQEACRLNKRDELVIASDRTRSQASNIEDCLEKLADIVIRAVEVPRPTSEETILRMKRLTEAADGKRLEAKKKQADKKASRKFKGDNY